MVNIPDEVKALFSSDIVHKNFHVTFPNGEYRDLNNEDVISESVQFTESLCSQQYFKFGLAEASQIEFTAVGIPNVRGAYIECAIEIDCTRLGAAWASDNPVDPTLDFLEPQTCEYQGKIFYRVPYGLFKVDTCPRDKGVMYQRKITAYSDTITSNEQMSPFEISKLNLLLGNNKKFEPNLMRLIFANVGYFYPQILTNYGYSATLVKSWSGSATGGGSFSCSCNGHTKTLVFEIGYEDVIITKADYGIQGAVIGTDELYMMDSGLYDYALDTLGNAVKALDNAYTPDDTSFSSITERIEFSGYFPHAFYRNQPQSPWFDDPDLASFDIRGGIPCIYPHRDAAGKWYFYIRLVTSFKVTESGTTLYNLNFSYQTSGAGLYKFELSEPTPLDDVTLTFSPTLKTKKTVVSGGNTYRYMGYSYSDAYSYTDILVCFLELFGWFLKPNRNGNLDFFQMAENPTAIPVPTSDWAEFWWDETPVESIGEVVIIYEQDDKSKKDQQQQTITIGDGNSVYTIKDNAVLKSANLTQTQAEAIINTYFAPNASVVNFTPVELSMRGLPYLESGDYIELTAEDGETVETYILSQTISGIQHLTAEVTSTNGALLEVIENE